MWKLGETRTVSPGSACAMTATRLAIVPLCTKSAASLPRRRSAVSSSLRTVGSSPKSSLPTSASASARRIAGVGTVEASVRRSIESLTSLEGLAENVGARHVGELPAVDVEDLTGDVAGFVRGQEEDGGGDIVVGGHAAERRRREPAAPVLRVVEELPVPRALDRARADCVDRDPVGRELDGRRAREQADPGLGGAIRRQVHLGGVRPNRAEEA